MTSTDDIYVVGITSDYGITLAMRSNDYSLYHLGDHIYCCARVLARDIIEGIKGELADQYLNHNQKIPIKKAKELLWQTYPDIANNPVLLAAQEDNKQYIYASQMDESASNNNVAVCGSGTAFIAEAMDWLVDKWHRDQNLLVSEQMARKVLMSWDTNVIVLYKRLEDAPPDIAD